MKNERRERIVMRILAIVTLILCSFLLTGVFVTFMDAMLGIERDYFFSEMLKAR